MIGNSFLLDILIISAIVVIAGALLGAFVIWFIYGGSPPRPMDEETKKWLMWLELWR